MKFKGESIGVLFIDDAGKLGKLCIYIE